MILELDCGNSFIKWRVIRTDASVVGGGIVDTNQALIEAVEALAGDTPARCRLVSVRTEEETDHLGDALVKAFGLSIVRALGNCIGRGCQWL